MHVRACPSTWLGLALKIYVAAKRNVATGAEKNGRPGRTGAVCVNNPREAHELACHLVRGYRSQKVPTASNSPFGVSNFHSRIEP